MSWDVVMLRYPGPFRPFEELLEEESLPLGKPAEVRRAIAACWPATAWAGGSGFFEEGDCAIEIHPEVDRKRGVIESVMLHVHGGDGFDRVIELARATGWRALDTSTSELLDPDNPSREGFDGYEKLVRKGRKRRK